MPVMDALREVHAVNILHRDISPDNIFINKKGQVILIDFGAARQAIGEKGRSLSIILKPGYAPEEQYRTKGIQGPWTDIYAIAATYYHLITGHQPPEALERLVEDPLELPSGLGVAISGNEEKALLKALAVRAADRFQTIDDFQNSLLGEGPAAGFKAAPVPVAVSSERPSPASAGAALAVKSKLPMKLVAIAAAAVLLIGGSLLAYNIFAAGGENMIMLAPGANSAVSVEDVNKARELMRETDLLLVQLECPVETVAAAIELAKAYNVPVVLNPAPAQPLSRAYFENVDYLTPNETELMLLTGEQKIDKAIRKLQNWGVRHLIITLGANGARVVSGTMDEHLPAYEITAVDTTAAGDAFNGALAMALAEKKPLREAVHYGIAAGALATTIRGAQPSLPVREAVENLMRGQKINFD